MKKHFILLGFLISLIPFLFNLGVTGEAQKVLAITLFVATLWLTTALPLWLTALMVPVLLALFTNSNSTEVFAPFFDPIIVLLLGGFVLAVALQKYLLDIRIAHFFINLFGNKPKNFLLGMMAATAFLSMWISNTASTLMMVPIAIAAIKATNLKKMKSQFSKALILGVGYAATIGGTITLIGTPANLIAIKFLEEAGTKISFAQWVSYALPPAIVMIFVSWLILSFMYKPEIKKVKQPKIKNMKINRNQKFILVIFAATALLWLTSFLHGVHSSLVAMLPVFAFFATGLLNKKDLSKVGWNVLILVGGSLSLGLAIHSSGLSLAIASVLGVLIAGQSPFIVYLIIALTGVIFTGFATNTGSAAILIPVVVPLAPILGVNPVILAILLAVVISYDVIVPVGTPPNTITYGTGYITVMDMVKPGVIISGIAVVLFSLLGLVW